MIKHECPCCGDPAWDFCPGCGRAVKECPECHRELAHGVIPRGTLHFVGNGVTDYRNTIDGDVDAYAPSWRYA